MVSYEIYLFPNKTWSWKGEFTLPSWFNSSLSTSMQIGNSVARPYKGILATVAITPEDKRHWPQPVLLPLLLCLSFGPEINLPLLSLEVGPAGLAGHLLTDRECQVAGRTHKAPETDTTDFGPFWGTGGFAVPAPSPRILSYPLRFSVILKALRRAAKSPTKALLRPGGGPFGFRDFRWPAARPTGAMDPRGCLGHHHSAGGLLRFGCRCKTCALFICLVFPKPTNRRGLFGPPRLIRTTPLFFRLVDLPFGTLKLYPRPMGWVLPTAFDLGKIRGVFSYRDTYANESKGTCPFQVPVKALFASLGQDVPTCSAFLCRGCSLQIVFARTTTFNEEVFADKSFLQTLEGPMLGFWMRVARFCVFEGPISGEAKETVPNRARRITQCRSRR